VDAQRASAHRTWSHPNSIRAQGLQTCTDQNVPSAANTARHTPLNPRSTRAVRQRRRPITLRSYPSAEQTFRIMGRRVEGVHRTQPRVLNRCVDGCANVSAMQPPIQRTRRSASRRGRLLPPEFLPTDDIQCWLRWPRHSDGPDENEQPRWELLIQLPAMTAFFTHCTHLHPNRLFRWARTLLALQEKT
jgi:hypothetical protein